MRAQTISIHFAWGLQGAKNFAKTADVIVVVDVLSFSTAVDIASTKNALIIPAPWKDKRAQTLAAKKQALLAVTRENMSLEHPYSLSPASLLTLPTQTRLVLPSPNGSNIVAQLDLQKTKLIVACLRNANAVANMLPCVGKNILVIAAGEHWPDGTLRPAVEDLIGAGAILSGLKTPNCSPEAKTAIAAFHTYQPRDLQECFSGKELIQRGFLEDVSLASLINCSQAVPLLENGTLFNSS